MAKVEDQRPIAKRLQNPVDAFIQRCAPGNHPQRVEIALYRAPFLNPARQTSPAPSSPVQHN
jgi:hypothetical protein